MTQLSMKYTLPEPILSTQQSLHFQPSQQNYTHLHWDYLKKKKKLQFCDSVGKPNRTGHSWTLRKNSDSGQISRVRAKHHSRL